MKHPAAPAGMPAASSEQPDAPGSRRRRRRRASSHDSAENDAAPTTASIHAAAADGDIGMNARNRSLSSPMLFGTTPSANRRHAASSPSPASVIAPASCVARVAGGRRRGRAARARAASRIHATARVGRSPTSAAGAVRSRPARSLGRDVGGGDAAVDDQRLTGHPAATRRWRGTARRWRSRSARRSDPSGCAPAGGCASSSSLRNLASIGVMIGPGHSALARMPWRA